MLSSNAWVIRRADGPRDPLRTATAETLRNGVGTAQPFGARDAVTADPSLGRVELRALSRLIDGAHDRTLSSD